MALTAEQRKAKRDAEKLAASQPPPPPAKGEGAGADTTRKNYRSPNTGSSKFELTEEFNIAEMLEAGMHLSPVYFLTNQRGEETPYAWLSDEEGEIVPKGFSDQIFFSKKGRKVLEVTGDKISKSKHSVRFFNTTDPDTGEVAEVIIICDASETGGAGVDDFAD